MYHNDIQEFRSGGAEAGPKPQINEIIHFKSLVQDLFDNSKCKYLLRIGIQISSLHWMKKRISFLMSPKGLLPLGFKG